MTQAPAPQTVGELDFPLLGFLETRRGPIVEVGLSNAVVSLPRTYVLVPEGAGEIPAGIYSTDLKQAVDLDDELGDWAVDVELRWEPLDAVVRTDTTLDDELEFDERNLTLASDVDVFLPQLPPLEREGDQPVNPYGLWAIDEEGAVFRIEVEPDEEADMFWVDATTRYGKSRHPFALPAVLQLESEEQAQELGAGDRVAELHVLRMGADVEAIVEAGGELPREVWRIGKRRALEAEATHPLPEFDPGQWMRWLTPVDGGDPIAFGGFFFPGDRVIELQPVMPVEPAWAAGKVLTIPRERPGVEFEDTREVTVYGKPYKELRSSVKKIAKRPPTPVGRFRLEAEGHMPQGWAQLG